MSTTENSLYERIGGADAVRAAVVKLYDKILADPLLIPFFEGIDVERLRKSQSAFVMMAFDGPLHYSGKGLRHAHAGMVQQGLSDAHFDAVCGHLVSSLEELRVPEALIAEAAATLETTRQDILNR